MERLSENFYLHEFTRSQIAARLGIDNTPNKVQQENLQALCVLVLQPLRDSLGSVHITSGFRCQDLNDAVGGSKNSAHLDGHASDIVVTGRSPYSVALWLQDSHLEFDQVILEFGEWVHVGMSQDPRGQVLTANRKPGRTEYLEGLRRV